MDSTFKLLQIKAKAQVHSLLAGQHLSKLYGDGYDFSELREYQIGDDIRKINWNISAKLQKPYIKEVNSNRELSLVVASFLDASLYFGLGNQKQVLMTQIASLIAYATQYNQDIFTGITYTQEHIYTSNPTKKLFSIEKYIEDMYSKEILSSKVNKQEALKDLFQRLEKPSLIFILSDFLEEVDLSILAQKHEIVLVFVRDEEEENPSTKGELNLVNPFSWERKKIVYNQKSMASYLEKLKENDALIYQHLSQHNIRYTKILREDSILEKLINL